MLYADSDSHFLTAPLQSLHSMLVVQHYCTSQNALLHQTLADQTHSHSNVLYAPYVTPKPSLVPSIAHANSPVLYYNAPNTSCTSQNTLQVSTALDDLSHFKKGFLPFPMYPRSHLCLSLQGSVCNCDILNAYRGMLRRHFNVLGTLDN